MKCPCQAWSDLQQQQRSRSQRPGLFAGCGVGIEGCGQGCGGVSGGWPTQDLPGGCCLWWVETNKAVIWWDILVVDTSCLKPLCFFSNGRSCFFEASMDFWNVCDHHRCLCAFSGAGEGPADHSSTPGLGAWSLGHDFAHGAGSCQTCGRCRGLSNGWGVSLKSWGIPQLAILQILLGGF